MSLALSPASPRLESSYAAYNNRDSSTRSSFSHESENSRTPAERPASVNLSYPAADIPSARGDGDGNQHEQPNWVGEQDMDLVVDLRHERSVRGNGAEVEHSGQDHDRIDIEMEDAASEQSSAEAMVEEQIQLIQHVAENGHERADVEMETGPDASANVDEATSDRQAHSGAAVTAAPVQEITIVPGDLNHPNNEGVSFVVIPPSDSQPVTEENHDRAPAAIGSLLVATHPQNTTMSESSDSSLTPAPSSVIASLSQQSSTGLASNQTTTDHDSDVDSSDDDDEEPFWASYQQDTSVPSEAELVTIAARTNDKSALDDDHWKREFFTDVEDPEHHLGEEGKLTWTLNGFHGTPANPNKEKFLRSPQIQVGGLWWSVKVFPRGDDGTDCVSVYIECSNVSSTSSSPTGESTDDEATDENGSWGSAAQVGCILYNGNDPKVQYNEKACHYFSEGNQDFGWVRFHGPWKRVHQRGEAQTRPLLQNDSLEVIAYIRTVHDYTGTLWWHPPHENHSDWVNPVKTGYRGLSSHLARNSSLAAALASWVHLRPFQKLLLGMPLPHVTDKSCKKPRPLLKALQSLLTKLKTAEDGDTHDVTNVADKSVSTTGIEDAMSWHSWDAVMKNRDVVQIWEALRYLLNLESSPSPKLEKNSADVLDFMLTMRQRMLFENTDHLAKVKIPSTQGILDDFVKGGPTVVPWDGFPENSCLSASAPEVLQMELPRQVFDAKLNRFMRSNHHIELNETISLTQGNQTIEYTLYGMIVHAGPFEFANYYSIVRPRGPNAPWVQYGHTPQGDITLLTRKQAIDAHQGNNNTSNSSDPIAYIVTYIRSDCLTNILPDLVANADSMLVDEHEGSDNTDEPNYKKASYNPVGIVNPWPKQPDERSVPETSIVEVFTSDFLDGYSGRGFSDVWRLESQRAKVANLEVPRSTTLCDIRERLVTEYNLAEIPEQCRLWLMNIDETRSRWSIPLRQYKLGTALQDLDVTRGVFRLWLHVIPRDEALKTPAQVSATSDAPAAASQSPPTSNTVPEVDAVTSTAGSGTITTGGAPTSTGLAMPIDQIQQEHEGGNPTESPVDTTNVIEQEDVSMGGTRDEPIDVAPAEVAMPSPQTSPTLLDDHSIINDVYIVVKSFHVQSQTLETVGAFLVSKKDQIGETLNRLNITSAERSWKIYCDESGNIRKERLRLSRTFESEDLKHGAVLVVQEKLSDAEEGEREIRNRGDCADVREHYASLVNTLNPCLAAEEYTRSYFGSEYFAMTLKRGRPHGPCKRIDMKDESYSGSYVSGTKQGQGTMKYGNGDVYTGEWMEDLPSGQGKRTYADTKNVYEGGWKKGKRHGKGVMHYEVADEEANTCAICYEKEIEAVFYRCGHAICCMECARRVVDCPLCRTPIEGVTRFLVRRLVL